MSLTVNPWRKSILQQIQIRNKVEQYPYESIITTCNSLFEKIDSLQREKLQLENNSTTNANKEKIIQLQDEIKEYKQSSTKFDETITELRAQLQKCDNERQEYKTKHTETLNMLQEAQRDSKALQEKINELESQNVLVTDEHQALQIAYTSLKEKYDSLEVNYSEIVNRFMALKAKDAEILNEENEKMLMIQREKMKKQLQEATKTMMVTSEAINEMNAINEDRIMNPLLINAILPSKESKSFEAHESEIYALKWNVRTEQLASGGGDRKVKLWEITNDGRTDCMTCLTGSNASVTSIDIFEEFLVASSNDYASRVWTLNDFRLRRTLTGHSNKVMSVKFLGVSHKVVSGSYDRTLKIWDLNRNACVRTLFAGSSCNDLVNIDSKETLVASAHFDKRIRFWDTRVEASPNDILLQGKVTSLDVSADGRWLLCSVRDDTLKCLDLRMNQVVRDYTADGFNVGCDWTRARFSPDHRFVACGGFDSNIYIWDFLTSRLETCLSSNVHSGTVVSVEWSPNGSVRREERNVLDELLDNQEDDELDVELNKGFRVKTRNIKMLKQYGKSSTLTGKEIDTTSGGQTDSKFKAINLNGTRKRPPSRADSSCSGYSPHSGSCSCEDHSAESRSRSPASVAGSQCSYQSFTRSPSCKLFFIFHLMIHKNSDSRMVKRSPPPPSRPTRPHPAESLIQDHRKRPKYVDDHHRQHYQHDNVRHQRNPKIISTSSTNTNVGKKRSYQSLLKYFFKDSCYFVMKSNNSENINISKREGVWATPSANEMKLTSAFREFRNVILIFSVKESGKFQGFARLSSEANYDCEPVNWVLPPSINSCPFGGLFYVDWICQHELPFTETTHLFNPFNEGKPVKIARDGQEIDPRVGEELCRLFPSDDLVDLIPLLKRMKKQTKNRPKKRHSRGPFMETADHQQHRMPSLHGRHHSSTTNPMLSIKRRLGGHGNGSSSSSLNNRTSTNNRRMVDHHRMAVNDRAIFRRDHILDDDGYNYRSSHPNNPSLKENRRKFLQF
ncbi:hypothetical protein BLOT_002412 [Blomia tropicalis]|nr:hypothetical protein BLOT_002412 [Blomia tropicalis]